MGFWLHNFAWLSSWLSPEAGMFMRIRSLRMIINTFQVYMTTASMLYLQHVTVVSRLFAGFATYQNRLHIVVCNICTIFK